MAEAKLTRELLQLKYRHLSPCARSLHTWLLCECEAGEEQEVFLEEFATQFSYTLRHTTRSFKTLVDEELVDVIRRYNGTIYKAIAHDSFTRDFGQSNSTKTQD